MDDEGDPVQLPGIHFVKVYTGVNQYCGWLGETSTEVMGAEDLHLTGGDVDLPTGIPQPHIDAMHSLSLLQNPVKTQLIIASPTQKEEGPGMRSTVYNLTGRPVLSFTLTSGTNYIDCPLPPGMYLLKINQQTIKFVKQ